MWYCQGSTQVIYNIYPSFSTVCDEAYDFISLEGKTRLDTPLSHMKNWQIYFSRKVAILSDFTLHA